MLLKHIEAPSGTYSSKVCKHRLHIGRTCRLHAFSRLSPASPLNPQPTHHIPRPDTLGSVPCVCPGLRLPRTAHPSALTTNARTKTMSVVSRTNEDAHTKGNRRCDPPLGVIPLLIGAYIIAFLDRTNIGMAKDRLEMDLGISATAYGIGAGLFS